MRETTLIFSVCREGVHIETVDSEDADCIIIGGGLTGAAVAWDLTLRGVDCAVVEAGPVAGGAVSRTGGLLRSGAAYASSDPAFAAACREENRLLRHLAAPYVRECGGLFLDLDDEAGGPDARSPWESACRKAGVNLRRVPPARLLRDEPELHRPVAGAYSVPDAVVDAVQLTLALTNGVRSRGGAVHTYTDALQFLHRGAAVKGVQVVDRRSGRRRRLFAAVVVNAAGAWAGEVAGLAGLELPLTFRRHRLALFAGEITSRVVRGLPPTGDAVLPASGGTVYRGEAGVAARSGPGYSDAAATGALREAARRLVPALERAPLLRTWTVTRPAPQPGAASGSAQGRPASGTVAGVGYTLFDHEIRDGMTGLVSLVSRELTTFRRGAGAAAAAVCRRLGVETRGRTGAVALPGREIGAAREKGFL